MAKHLTILPVKTDAGGDPVAFDVPDNEADTFLIMDGSVEEMRASSRHHAQSWIRSQSDQDLLDRAKALGWQWDEGGPHWYRNAPGANAFEPYQYAKTAEEAIQQS